VDGGVSRPVVVEIILERVTNIAMGTEIDNVNEFEDVLDLSPQIDLAPRGSSIVAIATSGECRETIA